MDSQKELLTSAKKPVNDGEFDREYIENLKENPQQFQKFRETGKAMFDLFRVLKGEEV